MKVGRRHWVLIAAAMLAQATFFSAHGDAQESAAVAARLMRARDTYAPHQWRRGPRHDGFALGALSLPGLQGDPLEIDSLDVTRTYKDERGVARVLVEMAVRESVDEAHAAMLGHLAHVESQKVLTSAAERGVRAGDAGYIAYGGRRGDRVAWVAFVVGNVEFRVVSLDPEAMVATGNEPPVLDPILDIVQRIASAAEATSRLEDGGHVSRPSVIRFGAEHDQVALGASLAIDLLATDTPGGSPALDFNTGGPGQGYVEQEATGRWHFHATGPGHAVIQLRALGHNGTVTVKSLAIEVVKA